MKNVDENQSRRVDTRVEPRYYIIAYGVGGVYDFISRAWWSVLATVVVRIRISTRLMILIRICTITRPDGICVSPCR